MSISSNSAKCNDDLIERFKYVFEAKLIKEMCIYGLRRDFEEDVTLMDLNQKISHIPIILSGAVKIMREDSEGKTLLLYFLEFGDTCAVTLNCCTTKAKSSIIAITETKTEILFIPVDLMESWMIKYHSWRAFVLESYNNRLQEMLVAIDHLAFHNMEERLYKYLSDKVWASKDSHLHTTHYKIAQDLNSSRVVISRLLKKLELDHKIIQNRNSIQLVEFLKNSDLAVIN